MASRASEAMVSLSAATARIGWPTKSGSSVSAGSTGGGGARSSEAWRTPRTPSISSTAETSTLVTRAWGAGLNNSLQNAMPSARKSSVYLALPVTFARTSGGVKSFPSSV